MAQNNKKKTRPGAKKAGDAGKDNNGAPDANVNANVNVNANGTATASRGGVPFAAAPEGAVATRSAKKKQGSKKLLASSSRLSARATSRGRGHASGGKGGGSARARSVSKSLHPRRQPAVTAEYEDLEAALAAFTKSQEDSKKRDAEREARAQAEHQRIDNRRKEMLDHGLIGDVLTHTSLEEKVDALKEDVDGLKEEYQAYKQETKQQVDDLQSQIDNLQSQLDARQRSRVAKILAAVVYWVMRPIFGI